MPLKWKLMFTTLPWVLGAITLKLVLVHGLGVEGFFDFTDVGVVLTGGVFLIGFMLAGTMADFKESEKLPAELACTLETLEETFTLAAASRPDLDGPHLVGTVLDCTQSIHDWLYKKIDHPTMFAAVDRLAAGMHTLERAGATGYALRAANELSYLRKLLTRMGVISRTGFLASGYAILETLTAIVVALLMIARFDSVWAEVVLVGFVSLVYVYMLRLIYDIDDPFEYSDEGPGGAAEVELFPFTEYHERLRGRAGAAFKAGGSASRSS